MLDTIKGFGHLLTFKEVFVFVEKLFKALYFNSGVVVEEFGKSHDLRLEVAEVDPIWLHLLFDLLEIKFLDLKNSLGFLLLFFIEVNLSFKKFAK